MTRLPEKLSVSHLSPAVLDGSEEREASTEEDVGRPILPAFLSGHRADESALRGIATHNFLQFCDFARLGNDGAENELSRLVELGFISRENAARVRLGEIERFVISDFFTDLISAKRLHREFRFNVLLPAAIFTEKPETVTLLSDEQVLVQGVIDCIVETESGELILADYKTDRLTKEELFDEEKARATLSGKHSAQLEYYSLAIEKIFGRPPSYALIYSLPLGKALRIDTKTKS